jgi:hypothetical protein
MFIEAVSHLLTKLGLKQEPDGSLHTTLDGGAGLSGLATEATLDAALTKLSADPSTETTLASILVKLADPATDAGQALVLNKLIEILAKQSSDPATQATMAALKTVMDNFETSGIPLRDQHGLAHNLHFVDGSFGVVAMTFEYAIVSGLCTDRDFVNKFGANHGIPNSSYEIVWEGGTTPYPDFSDSVALEFLSSSGDDDVAGIGARSIRVHGLEATTFAAKTVDYDTDGAGVVPMGNWARVNRAYPLTNGGSGGPMGDGGCAGTITIRKASAGATMAIISPEHGQTEMAIWTVPEGKQLVVSEWSAGSPENKFFTAQILVRQYGGSWRAQDTRTIGQGSSTFMTPFAVQEKGDVMVIAQGEGVSGTVFAGFKGVYEDTPA